MRYICTSIVATLMLAGTSFAQDAVEWRVEDGGNGHWYQVITAETGFPTYNPEAYFDLAESLGGYAVTITSENEDIFVYNLSLTVPGAWTIGPGFGPTLGARHLGGCSFEWITGEPWSYASWGPADPGCNGDYVAYCVCGQSTPNDTERWWADVDPSYGGNLSGVIEYSADCNGDGVVDYGQILDGTFDDYDGNGVPDPCDVPEADLTVDDDLLDYPEADFTSIQAAIDAAQDGDLILVYPGTYTGTGDYVVDFGAKQLQLIAATGISNTSIDGEDARGLINCSGYHDASTVIRGFAMTRANATGLQAAINFHGESGPTLSECRIHDMTLSQTLLHAGPTHLGDPVGHPRIEWCTFENMDMSDGGRCLSFNYNNPVIEGCTFRNNVAFGEICFSYWPNNTPTYIDCIFENNITGVAGTNEPGVLVARAGSHVSLSGCTFSENTMHDSCVVYGSYDVADTAFCGNIPSNDICGSWTDLGGNEFLNEPCLSFVDCNENGVPDYDDINSGYSEDCNNNSVPDECDVANFTSYDCDQNGVPDECQPDCDGDGWIDACDSDADVDGDGIPDNCETDCNGNTIPDDFEIENGWAQDCNGNLIPDECDIANDPSLDCDGNGALDSCEIEDDQSLDCNGNGTLDACDLGAHIPADAVQWTVEEGGNGNWYKAIIHGEIPFAQAQDIALSMGARLASVTSQDETDFINLHVAADPSLFTYDVNGCLCGGPYIGGFRDADGDWQWLDGSAWNWTNWHGGNPDGSPEEAQALRLWDFCCKKWVDHQLSGEDGSIVISSVLEWDTTAVNASEDCNANNIPDECDIADGTSNDANGNGIPDECEVDCNTNGVPDHWDIKTGTSEDCNTNGIPDECDTANGGGSNDVNGNSIPDECEADCNDNGSPDDWDVVTGWSEDCNENLIPDECDLATGESPAEGAVQWTVAEGGNGHWYYAVVVGSGLTWEQANELASEQGGYLVTAVTEAENLWISATLLNDGDLWGGEYGPFMGGWQNFDSNDYSEPDGGWEWITGEPWEYSNWTGCDNCCGGQAHMQYNTPANDGGYGWGDVEYSDSNNSFKSYIVEWDADGESFSEDCNANGIPDECDIADETSEDINSDGVPDECQCLADIDGSGAVTIDDILAVIGYWGSSNPAADVNSDGIVNITDLLFIFDQWGPCP